MNKETFRMQMLSGIITEGQYKAKLNKIEAKEKKSLNEHFIAGGMVGIGAINQIPSRAKADYEDAFEHFLGQKYELKEEMEEEMKEGGEEKMDENEILKEDEFTVAMNIQAVINDLLNMEGGKEALKLLEQIDEWNELVDMAANA